MVLCHEATHCFGVRHCVYASCIMNGSNHLDESESRPFAACPVDLRKIELTINQAKLGGKDAPPFDLVARERGLVAFFDANGLHEDAKFSRRVLGSLTGQPEPEPTAVPAAVEAALSEPPILVKQQSLSEKLGGGIELAKPLVTRQPSGTCAAGEETELEGVSWAPLEVTRLPSHDKGLLAQAYG